MRDYVSSIFTKLQVADRSQAIVRAREAGFGTKGLAFSESLRRFCASMQVPNYKTS